MVKNNHSWGDLGDDEYYLLTCEKTGVDFWDVKKTKFMYCPACGDAI